MERTGVLDRLRLASADRLLGQLYDALGDDAGDAWLVTVYTSEGGCDAVQIARELGATVDPVADSFTGDTVREALREAVLWVRDNQHYVRSDDG